MTTEAERIAVGLTEAQRRAILWLPEDGSWKDHRRVPRANGGVSSSTLLFLKERRIGNPKKRVAQIYCLTESSFNAGEKERGQMWRNNVYRLTPLGLEVRRILEQSHDD